MLNVSKHYGYLVLVLTILLIVASGCTSVPPLRVKHNDPVMRIAVDATSVSRGSMVRLQRALAQNGSWIVVDRAQGLAAIDREQRTVHQDEPSRFPASEKYARWGKLYGVGGIVVATEQCQAAISWGGRSFMSCLEDLTLVNATTGEIISTGEGTAESANLSTAPDWSDTVEKMTDNFPKRMIDGANPNLNQAYGDTLNQYREENKKLYQNE